MVREVDRWCNYVEALIAISDGNGRKNLISTSISIFFFGRNGIVFGKYVTPGL